MNCKLGDVLMVTNKKIINTNLKRMCLCMYKLTVKKV